MSSASLALGAVAASRRSSCLALDVLCSCKFIVHRRDVETISDLICVVVGTKSDLSDMREVSAEEGPFSLASSPLSAFLLFPSY